VSLDRGRVTQRQRLEAAIGVMLIAAAVIILILFVVIRATNVSEPVIAPTLTEAPTQTALPTSAVLSYSTVRFTSDVNYNDTFVVEVNTEPQTQCRVYARVFSLGLGNYQTIPMVDYLAGDGVCRATLVIEEGFATGEHFVTIVLSKGNRYQELRWSFNINP
jgi:hypothetical protein